MILDYNIIALLLGSLTTIVTIIVAACYKSKCSHCQLCGLKVDRDIRAEENIDENRISLTGIQGPLITNTNSPV